MNHKDNEHRPIEEQNHQLWYNENNASLKDINVTDQNFFPDSWFYTLGIKKEQHNFICAQSMFIDKGQLIWKCSFWCLQKINEIL